MPKSEKYSRELLSRRGSYIENTFYHVDRQGNLSEGDTIELEWPGRIAENHEIKMPENKLESLKEHYPEGISWHGARYANAITTKVPPQSQNLPGKMTANLASISTTEGPANMEPHSIHYERHIEMLRMLEFPEEHSRFQSFFAFSDLERAKDFAAGNKDAQIFKVEAESYKKRDMNY